MSGEPPPTGLIPPVVETSPIAVEITGRGLVWGVGGSEGHVGEKRAVWSHTDGVADHSEGLVDQILGQVVVALGLSRRIDPVVVAHQLRVELVGLAF